MFWLVILATIFLISTFYILSHNTLYIHLPLEVMDTGNYYNGTNIHLLNFDKPSNIILPSHPSSDSGNTENDIKKIAQYLESIDKSVAGINKSAKVSSDVTYYATLTRTTTYLVTFGFLVWWFLIR